MAERRQHGREARITHCDIALRHQRERRDDEADAKRLQHHADQREPEQQHGGAPLPVIEDLPPLPRRREAARAIAHRPPTGRYDPPDPGSRRARATKAANQTKHLDLHLAKSAHEFVGGGISFCAALGHEVADEDDQRAGEATEEKSEQGADAPTTGLRLGGDGRRIDDRDHRRVSHLPHSHVLVRLRQRREHLLAERHVALEPIAREVQLRGAELPVVLKKLLEPIFGRAQLCGRNGEPTFDELALVGRLITPHPLIELVDAIEQRRGDREDTLGHSVATLNSTTAVVLEADAAMRCDNASTAASSRTLGDPGPISSRSSTAMRLPPISGTMSVSRATRPRSSRDLMRRR